MSAEERLEAWKREKRHLSLFPIPVKMITAIALYLGSSFPSRFQDSPQPHISRTPTNVIFKGIYELTQKKETTQLNYEIKVGILDDRYVPK